MTPSIPPNAPPAPPQHVPTERELKIRRHVKALEELVITEARPSMAVKAARGTVSLGKYGAIALGAFTFARIVISVLYPEYGELLRLLPTP